MTNMSLVINYFKGDTILSGGMGFEKNSKHFTIKIFNKNMMNNILDVV